MKNTLIEQDSFTVYIREVIILGAVFSTTYENNQSIQSICKKNIIIIMIIMLCMILIIKYDFEIKLSCYIIMFN